MTVLTAETRTRLRQAVDQRRREQLGDELEVVCPNGWASVTGYGHHGCRCDACREASNESRRKRRAGCT